MTVLELMNKTGLCAASLPDPEKEVTSAYIGDLLSWVMGKAKSGDAWITIMSNKNILAVLPNAHFSSFYSYNCPFSKLYKIFLLYNNV